MSKFSNLAISKELAKDNRISIKKSLFGLCCNVAYQPTQSKITSRKIEFTQEDGSKLERTMKAGSNDSAQLFSKLGKLHETTLGNYLLEECHSVDGEFIAMQLSQFSQMSYQPVTDICIYEGDDAKTVINCL